MMGLPLDGSEPWNMFIASDTNNNNGDTDNFLLESTFQKLVLGFSATAHTRRDEYEEMS